MKRRRLLLIPALLLAALTAAFLIYANIYYHADASALEALSPDETVSVSRTSYGWLFDGPSETDMLVFYPGAKVEETAYAPLLHALAAQGMDVCLVKMPLRFALFGAGKAQKILAGYDCANRYVGGHSLGGAMAAVYAAGHGDELTGVILLAAYPTKPLDDSLVLISLYGSEDGVLTRDKLADGQQYAPNRSFEAVLEGGNHAQFGNYGVQSGDGTARVSAEEQQEWTVSAILSFIVRQ